MEDRATITIPEDHLLPAVPFKDTPQGGGSHDEGDGQKVQPS